MSESDDIGKLAANLQEQLGAKLGLRRGTLERRMRKAGRRLPGRLHRDARVIARALELDPHPKLRRRIDRPAVKAAHDRIAMHLDTINPRERRKDFWLSMAGSMAFNLLAVAALLVVVLKWRGLI